MAKGRKKTRMGKYLLLVLLLIAGLLIVVGAGIVPVNLFFAKDAINAAVRQNLGVELEIQGPLKLRLGFNPQLSASDLLLYTPESGDQPLVTLDHLNIQPILIKIFKGDVHLQSLSASGVVIDYCPEVLPKHNSETGGGDLPSFSVTSLKLDQIQLQCDRPELNLSFIPEALDLEASAGLGKPMKLEISGHNAGEDIKLSAVLGDLNSLLADSPDFPLTLQLSAFNSMLSIDGSIHKPLSEPVLTARIELDSDDPAVLLGQAGLSPPSMGSLQFKADTTASLDELEIHMLQGSLGQTRFSAAGLARGFSQRLYFELEAQLSQLDLNYLPDSSPVENSTGNWEGLDFQPWFTELQRLDARMQITVDQILGAAVAVEDLDFAVSLNEGQLTVDHSEMMLAGSQLSAQVSLDSDAACPELVGEVQLDDVDLRVLNQFLADDTSVGGRVEQASIKTVSCGETLADHVESLQLVSKFRNADPFYQGLDLPLNFDMVAIELAYQLPGRLAFSGRIQGEHVSAEIAFGSIADLLSESSWPLKIKATGAEAKLLLDGSAALVSGLPRLDGNLEMDISRFGALQPWIGSQPGNPMTASLSTGIKVDESGWYLANINAMLGRSSLRGSLSRIAGEHGQLLTAHLGSDLIDVDELSGLFPESENETVDGAADSEQPMPNELAWIEGWFAFPAIDFDLSAARITGANFELESVKADGHIRERLIEDSHLSLEFEKIRISGDFDADLRQRPWNMAYHIDAYNVDIGSLLARTGLAADVTARADHIEFNFVSEGQSIRQLLANSRLESHIESLQWKGRSQPGDEAGSELFLSEVEFTAAPETATSWSASGKLNAVPVRLWMQTPGIVETFNPRADFPLRLALIAGEDIAVIDAVIDRQSNDLLKADLTISGQRMSPDGVRLSELKPPLNDFEFSARLAARQGELHLADLVVRLGTSHVSGRIDIVSRSDQFHLGAQLHSSFLETDDFVSWISRWRSVNDKDLETGTSKSNQAESSEGLVAVIKKELDELTDDYSFDIAVAVDELYSSGYFLGRADFGIRTDEKDIHLKPLKITLPGGNIDAEYFRKYVEGGVTAGLKIHIERLEYGGLLRLFDAESTANGLVYLDTSMSASAADLPQLSSAVKGNLDLLVIPEDISAGFLDLWASNLIFALLPAISGSGKGKKMNCLVARFEVEDGLMESKNILLDSTEVLVHGRGSIDLGQRQLDLLFAPQAKLEKFLSISTPIQVSGPFDDFNVRIAGGGFVLTLFRWYMSLIYVPYKWLTGERFPPDGTATCYKAMDWDPDDIP